jgi:hypothetical protein
MAKKKFNIKKPPKELKIDLDKVENGIDYPVFCFKHLQEASIKNCEPIVYKKFIERAQKLSELGWKEIQTSGRHSFGQEKIPVDQIKPAKPPFVTPDIKELSVFRYTGDNHPFVAIRRDNVLHVIFIEVNFGDIYDHE